MSYEQYFEAMPCYLSVQDRDLRIVKANQRFTDDFGEHQGRFCYQVYKGRSEQCEDCPVVRSFHDGQQHHSAQKLIDRDGREVDVIVYTTPIRDASGEVVEVMEMSTDITNLTRWQRQVQESQERYRLLFEEVPCYITIQDRDLNIVEANRRFKEDFGNQMGCKCYQGYKHRDEECLRCPVQETFADGQIHHSEEVVTSRSGERINTLAYSAPIHDAQGNITSVMEMSANITPIRQLQSQLESTGLLISSISHGIKGLLTGLDGGIYLVNSGMEKGNDKRLKKGWEMVQRNMDRIRGMVLNILYYAKEREPNYEPIDAKAFAEEVCGLLKPKAVEHGVELSCRAAGEIGSLDADTNALRALLVNLGENSIDACRVDQRKEEHRASMVLRGEPDHVVFELTDNGIGMDQETREKAFSLFFSSKGTEGTGLGLFIASKIARAHHGTIDIESTPNEGTTFKVRLPRVRVEEPAAETDAAPAIDPRFEDDELGAA